MGTVSGRVNDSEPITIARNGDVCWCAWKGYRFVEHPALSIAEEYRDSLTGGVAGIPNAARPFGHPTWGVRGIGRRRPNDRKHILACVYDGEAVGAMGWIEAEDVSPECSAKRCIVCVGRECNGVTCSVEPSTFLCERQLQDRSRCQRSGRPGLPDRDLRSRTVREAHYAPIHLAPGPGMALSAVCAHNK